MKPLSTISLNLVNNKVGSSNQQDLHSRSLINYASNSSSRQSSTSPPNLTTLPIASAERRVRDSGTLLFMLAFLGFLAYTIWDGMLVRESDVNLIVHGHDSYGNICGRNNKAIKFVDRSGQNMTNKPFTKYTLINAQFERYTLDMERSSGSKNGELFYIKEQRLANELVIYDSLPSERSLIKKDPRFSSQSSNQLRQQQQQRWKRSPSSVSFVDQIDLLRRNQTLLNNIKSKLMYQYPPMYGYKPIQTKATPDATESNQRPSLSETNQNKPLEAHQLEAAETYEHSSLTVKQQANNLAPQAVYAAAAAAAAATRAQPPFTSSTKATTLAVMFDDHGSLSGGNRHNLLTNAQINNSLDPFEHVLFAPKSTSLTANKSPDILNQNEAGNQLLYLTECVDHCPSEDHVELIFYRCMPKNWRFSLFPNAINVTRTFIDDILTDVTHCYRELIYIFSFALVISLALLILLRFLASIIIWSCLTTLISLFISMAVYSWTSYYYQVLELNNLMPHDSMYTEKLATSDKWLIGSIFLTFLAFGALATVIFMRKRILLVTMLFKESGKAIADMPLLLLQPVLTFAALVMITAVWTAGLICLQSIKVPLIDRNTGFVVFKAETLYKVMKWYHIFAFLWVSHFAIACQHYVIGSAVSKWYFSTDRYNLHSPIGTSVSELILYYLGSVALGSFLVAIFKVIRIVTRQIQYLIQRNCMSNPAVNSDATGNAQSNAISNLNANATCGSMAYVWRMFIWFFDNMVMIINRDAYVEVAIHGHSFLSGAKRAFTILASNPLKLLAIKTVSNILLVVAKVCVVIGTVSMAVVLLEEKTSRLNYSWSPIIISAMYAYIVAHWFLSVYEMVIDALFICYCEDFELSKNREIQNQIIGSHFMSHILNTNSPTNHVRDSAADTNMS